MTETSSPISPFSPPPPPPRPLIVLLGATDLNAADHFAPLLAHEDLIDEPQGRFPRQKSPSRSRYHPYRPARSRNATPHPSPSQAESSSLSSLSSSNYEDDEDNSPLSDAPILSPGKTVHRGTLTPPSVPVSDKIRIPRPKGAGRMPFLQLVKWERAQLDAIKVYFSLRSVSLDYLLQSAL
jgi:hypothetical protein